MLNHYSLNRMLVLVVTAGYALFLADTLIEHWSILKEDLPACIPIIFSAAAFVAGLVTVVKWRDDLIKVFRIILLASIVVAILGVYYHVAEDEDDNSNTQTVQQNEKDKPLLAPLAFAGLAVVGYLGISRRWQAEAGDKAAEPA